MSRTLPCQWPAGGPATAATVLLVACAPVLAPVHAQSGGPAPATASSAQGAQSVSAPSSGAQRATAPAFEVASVKPSGTGQPGPLGQLPRLLPPIGGRFTALNVPLRALVRVAYGLHESQIVGGPAWLATTRFDITAKAEDGAATMDAIAPMLRALLADRFALRTHVEPRELPTYALVVARGDRTLGPGLRASAADCSHAQAGAQQRIEALARGGPGTLAAMMPQPGDVVPCAVMPMAAARGGGAAGGATGFGVKANGMPLQPLVALLTQASGRIVRDQTGLTGLFDWELTFDPQVMLAVASQAGLTLPPGLSLPPSDSPALFTAVQEQLGLKLESSRGPVDVLVIDSAAMPAPD